MLKELTLYLEIPKIREKKNTAIHEESLKIYISTENTVLLFIKKENKNLVKTSIMNICILSKNIIEKQKSRKKCGGVEI